jgi:hypothetical protein
LSHDKERVHIGITDGRLVLKVRITSLVIVIDWLIVAK